MPHVYFGVADYGRHSGRTELFTQWPSKKYHRSGSSCTWIAMLGASLLLLPTIAAISPSVSLRKGHCICTTLGTAVLEKQDMIFSLWLDSFRASVLQALKLSTNFSVARTALVLGSFVLNLEFTIIYNLLWKSEVWFTNNFLRNQSNKHSYIFLGVCSSTQIYLNFF